MIDRTISTDELDALDRADLAARGIVYAVDGYYVLTTLDAYAVCVPAPSHTHAVVDSRYALTPDGLSLAKARCHYLARR